MLTAGSISRETAAETFPFLAERFPGRRNAIKDFTHLAPDYVFWIDPQGILLDAKDAHRRNPPPGHEHILRDGPDCGGFLRGRLASNHSEPLIVIYCRPEALASDAAKMRQCLDGIWDIPLPLSQTTLVISDNGDIYGAIADIEGRLAAGEKRQTCKIPQAVRAAYPAETGMPASAMSFWITGFHESEGSSIRRLV